jgi:hypothetical protein
VCVAALQKHSHAPRRKAARQGWCGCWGEHGTRDTMHVCSCVPDLPTCAVRESHDTSAVRTSNTGLAGDPIGGCGGVAPEAGLAGAVILRVGPAGRCGACAPSAGQVSHVCRLGVVRRRQRPTTSSTTTSTTLPLAATTTPHTHVRSSHGRPTAALTRPVAQTTHSTTAAPQALNPPPPPPRHRHT